MSEATKPLSLAAPATCPPIRAWRFILFATSPCVANVLLAPLLALLHPLAAQSDEGSLRSMKEQFGIWFILVLGTLVVPLLETAIGQLLPVGLLALVTRRFWVKVVAAAAWFAGYHAVGLGAEAWVKVLGVLIPATVLAYSFAYWQRYSWWRAFWVTTVIHGLANTAAWVYSVVTDSW